MTEDDQDLLERIEALIANAWDDDEHETLIEARDRIEALNAEKEAARKEERAAIVAWLRENSTPHNDIDEWADEIEAGVHLK